MWIFKEPRKPRPVANLLIWEYGSPNKEKHLPTAPCFHLLTFHCLRKESYIISMICRVRNTVGASADSCSVWVTGPLRLQGSPLHPSLATLHSWPALLDGAIENAILS